jgi:hypothetical protein
MSGPGATGPAGTEGLPDASGGYGADDAEVAGLLGRPPAGKYRVVVRRLGRPAVLENAPFLDDGTPMPTRFWLVDPSLRDAVSRLESAGGVREADAGVDPEALTASHRAYAATRDADIGPANDGPRPAGGVGGTRQGVKCLHAHLAWWLAGGDDPVGDWVTARLDGSLLADLEPGRP